MNARPSVGSRPRNQVSPLGLRYSSRRCVIGDSSFAATVTGFNLFLSGRHEVAAAWALPAAAHGRRVGLSTRGNRPGVLHTIGQQAKRDVDLRSGLPDIVEARHLVGNPLE